MQASDRLGSSRSDDAGPDRSPAQAGVGTQADDLLTIRPSTAEVAEGVLALTLTGTVDMLTAPQARNSLLLHIGRKPRRLVVDLTGVTFLGSSGLAALVESAEAAKSSGVSMSVVAPASRAMKPLRTTGLDNVLTVFPDLDSAMRA